MPLTINHGREMSIISGNVQNTQKLVVLIGCFAVENGAEMYHNYNACAQALYRSLHLLFIAVSVIILLIHGDGYLSVDIS